MPKKIEIIKDDDEKFISFELMQSEIVKLANVGKQIKKSRLKQRTIILLLHDATKVSKGSINVILEALPDLEKRYLK